MHWEMEESLLALSGLDVQSSLDKWKHAALDGSLPAVSKLLLSTLPFVGQQHIVTYFHWHTTHPLIIQFRVLLQLFGHSSLCYVHCFSQSFCSDWM